MDASIGLIEVSSQKRKHRPVLAGSQIWKARMSFDPRFREMTNVAAVSGEVSLFRAVIARAFNDAVNGRGARTGGPDGGLEKEDAESREARLQREEARLWLLSDGPDFRHVCYWALLEPEAVRDAARRAIESADGSVPAIVTNDNRQVAA